MELRHLRYFVVVAEELHFRRAAERRTCPSRRSRQQIRQLEEEVGAVLLLRNQRKVELTAAGAASSCAPRHPRRGRGRRAPGQARPARRRSAGWPWVSSARRCTRFVPELLRAFRDQVARHRAAPARAGHDRAAAPARGRAARRRLPARAARAARAITIETVLEEPVVVALPDAHPLAGRERLRLEDLEGQPLVLLTPAGSPGLRDALAGAIERLGGEEQIVQEVAEMQTVVGLVAAGVGISLVPASVRALARQGVTYRPLLHSDAPAVRLAMAWRSSDDSPVLGAFLEQDARRPPPKERGFRPGPSATLTSRRPRVGEICTGAAARWGATKSS